MGRIVGRRTDCEGGNQGSTRINVTKSFQWTAAIVLGVAIAAAGLPLAGAAAARHRPGRTESGKAHGASTVAHHPSARRLRRPTFRPSRGAAAQEAARLGAAIGNDCHGKADMQRSDQKWVVLCSNGKTYVVESPPRPDAPALECSLAGTGPEPACFSE